MNCQFLRIQYSHLPNYITIFSILQCVELIQAPKTVHMLRKIIAVPNLSVPLFCTAVSQSLDFASFALYIPVV